MSAGVVGRTAAVQGWIYKQLTLLFCTLCTTLIGLELNVFIHPGKLAAILEDFYSVHYFKQYRIIAFNQFERMYKHII
jgi:hypothetical protein